MKTLSVTVIVKNEQNTLGRLLDTVTFADEIVVVDTGSDDNTVETARRYTDKVFFFEWRDDFAAARNFALEKAVCSYVMWLDADDVVPPCSAEKINEWKSSDDESDTLMCPYCTAFDDEGKTAFWFYRERILRNCPRCRWQGAVHEVIEPFGKVRFTDIEVHHRQIAPHSERNLAIYEKLIANGCPLDARHKYYYAREVLQSGGIEKAETLLKDFLGSPEGYYIDKIEALKLLSRIRYGQRDWSGAKQYLVRTFVYSAPRAEPCCLLGDCFLAENSLKEAVYWYEAATRCQETEGFICADYFRFIPYMQLCLCEWRLGNAEKSLFWHLKAAEIKPAHSAVIANSRFFANSKIFGGHNE